MTWAQQIRSALQDRLDSGETTVFAVSRELGESHNRVWTFLHQEREPRADFLQKLGVFLGFSMVRKSRNKSKKTVDIS